MTLDYNSVLGEAQNYEVYVHLAVILSITYGIQLIQRNYLQAILERMKSTKTFWTGALVRSIQQPINYLVYILGLTCAIDVAKKHYQFDDYLSITNDIRSLGLLVLAVWACLLLSHEWEAYLAKYKNRKIDRTTRSGLAKLLRIAIITVGVITAMQSMGYKLSGLLAIGGAGTVIAGLAAQDMLSNLFGGLMIYFDRPFAEGDWINSPDRKIEGTVAQIGWRMTKIISFDKRPIYVPNSVFSKIVLVNPSRMQNRRIKEIVGIRYDDAVKLPAIVSDIEKMIAQHPEIDSSVTHFVKLVKFGPSSLDCQIYCFTKTTNWVEFQAVQQDVLMRIIEIITAHQAEIAFPTTTVHVPDPVTVGP